MNQYRLCSFNEGYSPDYVPDANSMNAPPLDVTYFVMPVRSTMIHFVRGDLARALEDKGVLGIKTIEDFSHHSLYWEE